MYAIRCMFILNMTVYILCTCAFFPSYYFLFVYVCVCVYVYVYIYIVPLTNYVITSSCIVPHAPTSLV